MGILFDKNNKRVDKLTVDEINEVAALVVDFNTYEGNRAYTPSWSSAVDEYVQKYIEEVGSALERFKNSKLQEDKDNLLELIKKVQGIKNNGALNNWLPTVEKEASKVFVQCPITVDNTIKTLGIVINSNDHILTHSDPKVAKVTFDKANNNLVINPLSPGNTNVLLCASTMHSYINITVNTDGSVSYTISKASGILSLEAENVTEVLSIVDSSGVELDKNENDSIVIFRKDNYKGLLMSAVKEGVYTITMKTSEGRELCKVVNIHANGDMLNFADVISISNDIMKAVEVVSVKDSSGNSTDLVKAVFSKNKESILFITHQFNSCPAGKYTVTLRDGASKEYTVTVNIAAPGYIQSVQ